MTLTFKKRQKEMKRLEKQRAKAERRAQKKIAKRDGPAEGDVEFDVLTEPLRLDEDVPEAVALVPRSPLG